MFQKRAKPQAARKRDDEDDGETNVPPPPVPTVKRPKKAWAVESAGISASTSRNAQENAALNEDRSMDPMLGGFQATGAVRNKPSEDAVRTLETETEVGKDTRAMHERNQKIHQGLKDGSLETGVYRGLGGYKQYAERSEGAISASKYSGLLGPTRGMSNVRSTMRIEYWAACSGTDGGICKDYKETGYCGWGDSCKFLHDRSDYKSGHVIEREWEQKQKAIEKKKREQWEKKALKQANGEEAADASSGNDSDSDDEELPSSCNNCGEKWADCSSTPVQTVCGCHFCEDCAMGHYARTPKCYKCGAPTHGIFNTCDALEEKLKRMKAAAKEQKCTPVGSSSRPGGLYNNSME